MANLSVTNTFVNGTTIDAPAHNTNYSDIVNYINNRNDGSVAWDGLRVTSSSIIPVIINNSTGAFSPLQVQDNGGTVFEVFDGGVTTTPNQSSVSVRMGSNQVIPANTDAVLVFDTEDFDVQSEFDAATNYDFTAGKAGKYQTSIYVSINSTAGIVDPIEINIEKNSLPILHYGTSPVASSTKEQGFTVSGLIDLAATDVLEAHLINPVTNGSLTVNGGTLVTKWTINKVA